MSLSDFDQPDFNTGLLVNGFWLYQFLLKMIHCDKLISVNRTIQHPRYVYRYDNECDYTFLGSKVLISATSVIDGTVSNKCIFRP